MEEKKEGVHLVIVLELFYSGVDYRVCAFVLGPQCLLQTIAIFFEVSFFF